MRSPSKSPVIVDISPPSTTRFTFERWTSLIDRFGLRTSQRVFETIKDRYSNSSLAYHNVQHINDCLEQFDAARAIAEYPDEVEFAIWFHDVIYDTHRADNEAMSAAFAADVLREATCEGSEIANDAVDRITANILATAHRSHVSRIDEQLIVDIDLSILGRPAPEFDRYETAIRKEYNWVPKEVFVEKRAEILRTFLDRERIYLTESFFDRYEANARQNLERAIQQLI